MRNQKHRIFLSYSFTDRDKAEIIREKLLESGIEVIVDYNSIGTGNHIFQELKYLYESSETVIVLLSKKFCESAFIEKENEIFLKEAGKRKITIIPLLIENCRIPSEFIDFEIINLTRGFDKGIQKVVEKLKLIPEISFEHFTPSEFNNFVVDLLKEFGFKSLTWQYSDQFDFGIDLIGEYWNKNPFGQKNKETWIVEIKYYGNERFSTNSIYQLVDYYKRFKERNANLLLITNSILTSVSEEFLEEIQKDKKIPIVVLDGNSLKQIIPSRKKLLNKYFSNESGK